MKEDEQTAEGEEQTPTGGREKRMMKLTSYVLTVMFTLTVSAMSLGSPGVAQRTEDAREAVPRFEAAACAVALPEAEKDRARCGYLVAAENRKRRGGRIIRLPVIVLKSSSPNPAPDPVLRTLGGPGVSSLRMVRGRPSSPWLKERDLVIFEQRGTRYARPVLDCPEVDAAKIKNAETNADEKSAARREVEAAKACRDRLTKEGVDLAAYDSAESAADIEDLRRVLGYKKWNLYGVSYSARLMLEVMRYYPEGVRSVVLESVLPPSVNYDEVGVDGAMRSLKVLFSNCAAEAECAGTYPGLEKVFYDLVRRANSEPIQFGVKRQGSAEPLTLRLTGHDITTWVLDYILSAEAEKILAAPSLIYRVSRGDYEPLKDYAESKVSPEGYAWGMRYSVWCREEMPFENRRTIAAQSRRHPPLRGYRIQGSLPAICDAWGVPPAGRGANRPVTSDIPTLILAGEYDAYTPPAWGQLAARTLRNSYFYEVPGVGHGPGFFSACAIRLANDFLRDPSTAPKHACLGAPRPKFTTTR